MNSLLTVFLLSTIFYLGESGDFKVRNQPKYLSLAEKSDEPYHVSTLTNNLLVLLGLSPSENTEVDRAIFYSNSPWSSPNSIWIFHVQGVNRLSKSGYPLVSNEVFDINKIQRKLTENLDNHGVAIEQIPITSELDLNEFQSNLEKKISSLDREAKVKYVEIDCEICENEQIVGRIRKTINQIGKTIGNENPEILSLTIGTKEKILVRRARQTSSNVANVTIAEMYSDQYPVMFNLFFWSSLVFAVIIVSIVYVFLTLDPGSDTIIYRMTTPRLKVD